MQPLLAAPRDTGLTAAQVRHALTVPTLDGAAVITTGLDLLDLGLGFLADISTAMTPAASTVTRNNAAKVQGTARIGLAGLELPWGRVLVRPRMTITVGGVAATFWLGVYELDAPQAALGSSAAVYDCQGSDLVSWLDTPIGDTWSSPDGASVVAELTRVLAASGVPIFMVDPSSTAVIPAGGRQWLLSQSGPTWLDVVNDLATLAGYRAPWADWAGTIRVDPLILPANRAAEWAWVATPPADGQTVLDANPPPTVDTTVWNRFNWWRFVQNGLQFQPGEGFGQYTVADPAGVALLGGRRRAKVTFVDAADQATLQAIGDRTVAADKAATVTINAQTRPMPLVWHDDVATWSHPASGLGVVKVVTDNWTLPLNGSPMSHTWEVVS